MNNTKPIKDRAKLDDLLDVYPIDSKNNLLLNFLLYTGLRISDALDTKVIDIKNGRYQLRESKTSKIKELSINKNLMKLLSDYISKEQLSDDDYLFFARGNKQKHFSRTMADKIIRNSGDMIDIKLSAHSLRKTFGYLAYKNNADITLLMTIFNHSSQAVTLRYIGIEQDNIDEVYEGLDFSL